MFDQLHKMVTKHREHLKACDSCIVVILSHGKHGSVCGTDGIELPVSNIINEFTAENCPEMANKPKLFFFQACRGERFDLGSITTTDGGGDRCGRSDIPSAPIEGESGDQDQDGQISMKILARQISDLDFVDADAIKEKIPSEADTLIAYATTPGYVSWRNSARGSWFIQSICEVFSQYAQQESILDLLTRVNARVAEVMSSSGHKQMPDPSSRLRKRFYFYPGVTCKAIGAASAS